MNIAVIGLGSMGMRRIGLIREITPESSVTGVDFNGERRKKAEQRFKIQCCEVIGAVDSQVDCVFVCTSPLSHHEIIREALIRDCHVFTELNLVADGYEGMIRLAKERSRVLFLSSPFLYREEMRYIRGRVTGGKWNYLYHIGQYLPDWHP